MALCAEMLLVTGLQKNPQEATRACDEAVTSGRALEIFDKMCAALGGPADFSANSSRYLAKAPVVRAVYADGSWQRSTCVLSAMRSSNSVAGAGRLARVWICRLASVISRESAARLDGETPLALVHAASEDAALQAERLLLAACAIGEEAPPTRPVIYEKLSGDS